MIRQTDDMIERKKVAVLAIMNTQMQREYLNGINFPKGKKTTKKKSIARRKTVGACLSNLWMITKNALTFFILM